ncbi:epoxyqueuosine reductase [Betaproteobacteria bacterium]|nr:epoxyqueuosine reductase [Betaproteobacteria bacterium]GHU41224.1 epoxyqueuosine reductase [Betaproteobacteria bacterium]
MHDSNSLRHWQDLAAQIEVWSVELGFAHVGITRLDSANQETALNAANTHFAVWLAQKRHGEMDYMARNQDLRAKPETLLAGTRTVISAALDYWPEPGVMSAISALADPTRAYVSRYALGRDYHKVVRKRLQTLASRIEAVVGAFSYRVFSDSAPVMEVEFARQNGIGWRGKHTLLLSRQGSFNFLGEIYCDLPLPASPPQAAHCGSCTKCLRACPTQAIVAPYEIDARRCISYLTIEFAGVIPEALRPAIGNRIYGCDDCQLVCPWNRDARVGAPEFAPRHALDTASLVELMAWDEADFLERFAGSPIRRIGHQRWLRNIAVALGNGKASRDALTALSARVEHPSAVVREHVGWAIRNLEKK